MQNFKCRFRKATFIPLETRYLVFLWSNKFLICSLRFWEVALIDVREPSFDKFESMLSWNIWRIRSNIGFRPHLRLLIPSISHFDSGNRSGGRYKDILRKTDSRPKGFQASLFILRILAKFLPQMKLFILQISSGSYQNSQLAPSEGHFLGARSPVARLASSSSRRH